MAKMRREHLKKKIAGSLIKDLQIGAVAIQQVERVGQTPDSTNTKKRLMKLMLTSEVGKGKVLDNLKILRGTQTIRASALQTPKKVNA